MPNTTFVVAGAGPVGRATARELLARLPGAEVRLVSRSGRGSVPGARAIAADLTDPAALADIASQVNVIFNALNPPHYHRWPTEWPPLFNTLRQAAQSSGAVLASVGNLYPYGAVTGPITAQTPENPVGTKGKVRSQLWAEALAAHQAGRIRAVEVRASDYLSVPTTSTTVIGIALKALPQGRTAQVLGDPDQPHSWGFIPDVAKTLVAAALEPTAQGRLWIVPSAPARTQRDTLAAIADHGGWPAPKIRALSITAVALGGLFSPTVRETAETDCERDRPFVVDTSETTARLGVEATPWVAQCAAVVGELADAAAPAR
jgi:nucleoside-diphosphate-sugar epimerase